MKGLSFIDGNKREGLTLRFWWREKDEANEWIELMNIEEKDEKICSGKKRFDLVNELRW